MERTRPTSAASTLVEQAFDAYYEALYRYAYVHLSDRETAEDIAAQVFHRLLENHAPIENLRAWLYQVARNLIIDHSRLQRRRNHAVLSDQQPAPENIEAQVDHALQASRAHEAILKLKPRQREIIILRFIQELDTAEVAAIMNLSPGAVKTLQHRAVANLRRMLKSE